MSFAAARRRPVAAAADGEPRRSGSTSPAGCIVTLPDDRRRPDVEAVYEDIGECDAGSLAGLKALYSDARKRAAVAAGIGAYLYTALAAVVLPIGPGARQVQASAAPARATCCCSPPTPRRGCATATARA